MEEICFHITVREIGLRERCEEYESEFKERENSRGLAEQSASRRSRKKDNSKRMGAFRPVGGCIK